MKTAKLIFLPMLAICFSSSAIADGFTSKHRQFSDSHYADYRGAHDNQRSYQHYRTDHHRHPGFKHRHHDRGDRYKKNRRYRRDYQRDYFGFSYFGYYDQPGYSLGYQYGHRPKHRHHSNCRH